MTASDASAQLAVFDAASYGQAIRQVASDIEQIKGERPVKPFSLSGVMGEDLELRPALMPALCLDRVVEHVASGDRLGR
jgi:hypothetical protein